MYETELIDFISNIIFLDIQTWFHMAIFKTRAPDVKNCFGKLINLCPGFIMRQYLVYNSRSLMIYYYMYMFFRFREALVLLKNVPVSTFIYCLCKTKVGNSLCLNIHQCTISGCWCIMGAGSLGSVHMRPFCVKVDWRLKVFRQDLLISEGSFRNLHPGRWDIFFKEERGDGGEVESASIVWKRRLSSVVRYRLYRPCLIIDWFIMVLMYKHCGII